MKRKFLLIDASSLLSTSYYGTLPKSIFFVFDKSRNTFRRTELGVDFYKANHGETPAPLKEQFVNMEKLPENVGFTVLYGDDFEAIDEGR